MPKVLEGQKLCEKIPDVHYGQGFIGVILAAFEAKII